MLLATQWAWSRVTIWPTSIFTTNGRSCKRRNRSTIKTASERREGAILQWAQKERPGVTRRGGKGRGTCTWTEESWRKRKTGKEAVSVNLCISQTFPRKKQRAIEGKAAVQIIDKGSALGSVQSTFLFMRIPHPHCWWFSWWVDIIFAQPELKIVAYIQVKGSSAITADSKLPLHSCAIQRYVPPFCVILMAIFVAKVVFKRIL